MRSCICNKYNVFTVLDQQIDLIQRLGSPTYLLAACRWKVRWSFIVHKRFFWSFAAKQRFLTTEEDGDYLQKRETKRVHTVCPAQCTSKETLGSEIVLKRYHWHFLHAVKFVHPLQLGCIPTCCTVNVWIRWQSCNNFQSNNPFSLPLNKPLFKCSKIS